MTEKMKQTIRSKLEMLKRSSSQTNGDLAIRADLYLAIRADLLAPECFGSFQIVGEIRDVFVLYTI